MSASSKFLAAWTQLPTPAVGLVQYVNFTQFGGYVRLIARDGDGKEVVLAIPVPEYRALVTEMSEHQP